MLEKISAVEKSIKEILIDLMAEKGCPQASKPH
jgi:hypothetical protein